MDWNKVLHAFLIVGIIILIGALVFMARKALNDPVGFVSDLTKNVNIYWVAYRKGLQSAIDTGFDNSIGRIPVVGHSLSGIAKSGTYITSLIGTKPLDFMVALASGDPGAALNAITSTPMDVYDSIKKIF